MASRWSVLAVALVALLLVGCGGDDGEGAAADGPAPDVCADLEAAVVTPVVAVMGDEDRDEGDDETVAALRRVAAEGPDEVAADASAILEDRPDDTVDEQEAAVAAGDRLVAWAVDGCDPGDQVVWRCLHRSTFNPVGAAIEVPGVPPPDGSPEDVVRDAETDDERVEVSRTDELVVFAWLDADGLATRSETVVEQAGRWSSETTSQCDTPDQLRFESGPVSIEEDLPPAEASTTSIP